MTICLTVHFNAFQPFGIQSNHLKKHKIVGFIAEKKFDTCDPNSLFNEILFSVVYLLETYPLIRDCYLLKSSWQIGNSAPLSPLLVSSQDIELIEEGSNISRDWFTSRRSWNGVLEYLFQSHLSFPFLLRHPVLGARICTGRRTFPECDFSYLR